MSRRPYVKRKRGPSEVKDHLEFGYRQWSQTPEFPDALTEREQKLVELAFNAGHRFGYSIDNDPSEGANIKLTFNWECNLPEIAEWCGGELVQQADDADGYPVAKIRLPDGQVAWLGCIILQFPDGRFEIRDDAVRISFQPPREEPDTKPEG